MVHATRRPFLKIAELSDVHVGNRRTPTSNTLALLEEAFPDNAKTGELDIIFIAGDFFDKALPLATTVVGEIHSWISKFIKMCAKWDISLRVLEGTPSHDRGQPILFDWLAATADTGADVKYFSGLHIEHMPKYGIDVLYIQDELTSSCAVTQEMVTNALLEKGLSKVDYTIMHGMFSHRIPKGVIADAHDVKFYQDITRKYVFCGHIHINARCGNILEAGSSDRISFNEEEDKGHWRVYESAKGDTVKHVKHANAWTYKSIDVSGLDYSACVAKVAKVIKPLRDGSYIQLAGPRTDDGIKSVKLIEEEFPNINFKVKDTGIAAIKSVTIEDINKLTMDVVELTPDNLLSEVSMFAKNKSSMSEAQQQRCLRLLKDAEGV